MTNTDMHIIVLPATFYDDHRDRGLPSGTEIRRTKNGRVTIEATTADIDEIRSDADFYSWCVREMGSEYAGLQSSARATVRAIDKATA